MKKWFHDHPRLVIFFALLAAAIVYVGFNLWQVGRFSIWFDESFSAFMVRHNFAEIWHYTRLDVNGPLYYFLLKIWSMIFGHDVTALRSFSILCGVGVIIVGFFLTRKLFGQKTAWFALPLLTLSPMLVRYGTEMRTYVLTTLLIFAAIWALAVAAEKNQRKAWLLFGVLASLAAWSHYYAVLPLAAGFAWFMATRWQKGKKIGANLCTVFDKNVLLSLGLAFVLFLPWLGTMIWQIGVVQSAGFWIAPISFRTLGNFFGELLVYLGFDDLKSWWMLGALVWIILAVLLAMKVWRSVDKKSRQNYLLILTVVIAPLLILMILSVPPLRSMFINRYVLYSMIFASVFAAVLASAPLKNKKFKRLQVALFLLTLIFSILGVMSVAIYGNFNRDTNSMSVAKTLMAKVANKTGLRTIVIADSPWVFYDAVNYATEKNPVYFLDSTTKYEYGSLAMLRDDTTHKIVDLSKFVKPGQKVWFISSSDNAKNPPIDSWQKLRSIEVPYPLGDNDKSAWAVEYLVQ